jgi:xanthine/CO dehydrogenase XdhC/CoxF family maturation factor
MLTSGYARCFVRTVPRHPPIDSHICAAIAILGRVILSPIDMSAQLCHPISTADLACLAALSIEAEYVGFVGSRKKTAAPKTVLKSSG